MSQLIILGRDRKIVEWSIDKPKSITMAKEVFENKLSEGYAAFKVFRAQRTQTETIGEQLLDFDRDAETIQMTPPMVGG